MSDSAIAAPIRRILARDLRPGDVFEYERQTDHRKGQMQRDTVKPDGTWRSWWGTNDEAVLTRTVTAPPAERTDTAQGGEGDGR